MSPQFTPTSFQARTRETHAHHVKDLDDPVLASILATTYGLNRDSILNSLQFFHVTEGLPPDIMHDILEGALQYEMKEMLLIFTGEKGYFTLNTLNQRIKEFSYFYADMKDKPSEITLHSTDNGLNQEGTSTCRCKVQVWESITFHADYCGYKMWS